MLAMDMIIKSALETLYDLRATLFCAFTFALLWDMYSESEIVTAFLTRCGLISPTTDELFWGIVSAIEGCRKLSLRKALQMFFYHAVAISRVPIHKVSRPPLSEMYGRSSKIGRIPEAGGRIRLWVALLIFSYFIAAFVRARTLGHSQKRGLYGYYDLFSLSRSPFGTYRFGSYSR